jgi:predicted permease
MVWRPRGFLPLASLTLAIGLAAFAASLTMVQALLRSPPFPNHESVVVYGGAGREAVDLAASPTLYDVLGLPPGVVSRGAAQLAEAVNVRVGGRNQLARAQGVDPGFLTTLGVNSVLPEDRSIRFDHSVMLSYGLWQDLLGGDVHVVGRPIVVNGEPMSIRGVLPSDYRLFSNIDLLVPLPPTASSLDSAANLFAVARLAPGTSGESMTRWMQAKLSANSARLRAGGYFVPPYATVPLDRVLTYQARPMVLLFFGCSLLVLAASGLNLSNLLLSRALTRTHETCLTAAFGGPGWGPMLPLIADVAAIGLGAWIAGLLLARGLVLAVRDFVPDPWLISAARIDLDWRVCAVTGLASFVVAVASAMLGAVHASPNRLLRTLFASGGTSPSGLGRRVRRWLALVQTALATLLLVLGVAAVQRLWLLSQIPLGFQPKGASFVEINPDSRQYPSHESVLRVVNAMHRSAVQLPGVDVIGISTLPPIGRRFVMPFHMRDGSTSYLRYAMTSPGAIEAMGLSVLAGRSIDARDVGGAPGVAVVNRAYLEKIDSRGVGGWVRPASRLATNRPLQIVGVVADTLSAGAGQPPEPMILVPLAQVDATAYAFIRRLTPMFVFVRGNDTLLTDRDTLHTLIGQAAPGLAAGQLQSLLHLGLEATAEARRNAVLAAVFAVMALSLACIGLFGVQSLEVASRRRDTALRDALGAAPMDMLGHTMSRGLGMATPGIALGVVAAAVVEQLFGKAAQRFGSVDVGVVAAVALLMTTAALGAIALPSLRVLYARPASILRGESTTSPRGPPRHEMFHS